jgi:hypothetical protein
MDYNLDVTLVGLVAHRRFDGGSESSVAGYASRLFDRYDTRIRNAAAATSLNRELTARERSIVACIAAMIGGTADDAARRAVATFVDLFAS